MPTCRVGSAAASPSVTISFFSRTFIRPNGMAVGARKFQLEMVEPAAEQRAMPQLLDQRIDAVIGCPRPCR